MNGELRVVDNVPETFADLVATELRAFSPRRGEEHFHLGASGGESGKASFRALGIRDDVDFSRIELFFADERCVEPTSPDANQRVIADALGPAREKLAAFHPMRCPNGPAAYEARLKAAGRLQVLQLGLGPDGHTASLFPGSEGAAIDDGRLVVANRDLLGENPFDRMTLTFAGIATAALVLITVIGANRAGVLRRLAAGEDLPAGRVRAERVLWLVDPAAASVLEGGRG